LYQTIECYKRVCRKIFIKSLTRFQMRGRGDGYWLTRQNQHLYTQCCTSSSSGRVLRSWRNEKLSN